MSEQEILAQLGAINQKIDRILSVLETIRFEQNSKKKPRSPKSRPAALTPEEMEKYKTRFLELYEQWLAGDELGVQAQLDKFDPEEIRRFADSNNLNVTSKMSKDRVLHLIGVRFRERKQLHHTKASLKDGD